MADVKTNYYNTAQYKNAQAMQNETIPGLAQKYGFDFSQGYANNQAETAAQAQRLAQQAAQRDNQSIHDLTSHQILNDYNNGARSLDQSYFMNYMNQAQNQSNRGLNGGLVADQNLRLGMNKQNDVGKLWQDRNQATMQENSRYGNTSKTINDALAQIEKEKSANAQKMYQDLLSQAYGVLSSDRSYGLQLDNSAWGKYQDMFNNDMAQKQLAASRSAASARQSATQQQQLNAEALLKQAQDAINYDSYKKMYQASPVADPNATSGITSQPGSYWYARGYGSQYLPK